MPAFSIGGDPLLDPLLVEKSALRAAFGKRKEDFAFQVIDSSLLPAYEREGWIVHKEGVRRTRIKKRKDMQHLLEDQVWSLFYRLGYLELNGENFHIQLTASDDKESYQYIC